MCFDETPASIGWHPNWKATSVTLTRTRRTVLVVEDAIAVRNMLEDFLSLYGFDVMVASHPDTAFKRMKQSAASLDAMILDIGLDDNRSGVEVLELMRLDDRFVDLPVVVLTGLNLTDEEEESIHRNGAHLLYKKEGYERVFNRLAEIIAPISGKQAALPKVRVAR
jgi:DNA-binding response OmpR family regulator